MDSLYHAYQSYERQAVRGIFCTRKTKTASHLSYAFEYLLSDLGDVLIRAGYRLKRHCETGQTVSGSPVLGKLNR